MPCERQLSTAFLLTFAFHCNYQSICSAIMQYERELSTAVLLTFTFMGIEKEFIGAVIGPGGKVIQEMQLTTGATIHIEEIDGKGEVVVMGTNSESVENAVNMIKGLTEMPEAGEEYEATVKSIMPYGAFVEFLPGKEGLLHISEVSWERLENLDGVLKEGDSVKVKLLAVDAKTGRFKLSRKVLMPRPEGAGAPSSDDRE